MDSFGQIMQNVRNGSQEAAWDLIQQYGPQILRVVRRRMPDSLRRKFDSQDFVQAAWASVFTHRSRLVRFEHSGQFVAYMAAVAGNKVGMEVRRRVHGQKYNVGREKSFDDSQASPTDPVGRNEPSPSQIAVARERWFQIVGDQPHHYRQIIEMRYAGASYSEIAERLGFDESTVRRAVRRILRDQEL